MEFRFQRGKQGKMHRCVLCVATIRVRVMKKEQAPALDEDGGQGGPCRGTCARNAGKSAPGRDKEEGETQVKPDTERLPLRLGIMGTKGTPEKEMRTSMDPIWSEPCKLVQMGSDFLLCRTRVIVL